MDNAPSASADGSVTTHVVETDGCFGTVRWNVCDQLYSIMPRNERDRVLDMTGRRKIQPFFVTTTERLLSQVGCNTPSAALDTEWSLETIEVGCDCIGQIFWSISQGLWDALPADQRASLLELVQETIKLFFHTDITHPLFAYAAKKLMP